MGAHAGVLFFDGRSVEDDCHALIAGLRPIAPDGVTAFAEHSVAMMYGAFHVWARERSSQQPRRSAAGLVMTWDGRLDNRDDLRLRLGATSDEDTSDTAIALSVFERWGADGLRWLIGDWSAVIWDCCQRRLHLARDYMGVRPLYYCTDGQSIMWSSSLGELATRAGRADTLDEGFVARFMTLQPSTDMTPYVGIRAVPAANCVSFSAGRSETKQRFWSLEPGIIRYRDKRLYEEQLRALWQDAVGARLDVDGTVWAELSGGLDSSSVVCMADALIKGRAVQARALQPLSHVTLHSPEGDERSFIAEVEAQIGIRSNILGVEEHQDMSAHEWDWVTPLAPRGVQVASVYHVRQHGGRLILSGRLGDVVMGCSSDNSVEVFDELADGELVAGLSKMRRWSRACRKPFVEIAWQLLREALRPRLAGTGHRALNDAQRAGAALLTSRLGRLVPVCAVSAGPGPRARISKRGLTEMVLGYSRGARLEVSSDVAGVTYTYPFAHRPLVEYMLAIPGEELSAPGETRSLMRRAFQGLTPPRVLRRASKGYYPPAVMRAIRPLARSLLPVERLDVVRRGWIDGQRLDAVIRALVAGGHTGGEVQRVLCLEQWLTSRDRRAPAAMPKRKEVTTNAVLNA